MEGLLAFIDVRSMLLYLFNFLLLLVVVYIFLYKPIIKFIDKRTAKYQAERDEIDAGKMQIDDIRRNQKKDYNAVIAKGEIEVNDRLMQADENAKLMQADSQAEAQRLLEQAKVAAEEEKTKAREAIREEVSELAVQLAGRILQREVKASDHKQLIDEFLDKVG